MILEIRICTCHGATLIMDTARLIDYAIAMGYSMFGWWTSENIGF